MLEEPSQLPAGSAELLPMLLVGNGIVGGTEEYVLSLLRSFRAREQRALVAAPFLGPFTEALLDQGHPAEDFYIFDMGREINFRALAHLVTVLRARRVSLVHSHLIPADVLGAAAAAQAGIPAVSTLHGTCIAESIEEVLLGGVCGLNFLAVSRAGKSSAIAAGVPPERVRHLPNGVDSGRFDPARYDRERVRRELRIDPAEVLAVNIGRLAAEKDPAAFVRAAEIAGSRDERLRFLLVGSGPLEPEMRQAQQASPLGERLRVIGERRDVPKILAASDVLGLTSRAESSPFAVLEAMAMQVPAVCYAVGGVGELLDDGRGGYLVPAGDTEGFAGRLLELAADPALRRELGSAGRRRVVAEYDLERMADRVLDVYRELLGGDAVAPPHEVTRPVRAAAAPIAPSAPSSSGLADNDSPPVVDSHLHLSGSETAEQVLEALDAAGLTAACLIGPFLDRESWVPATGRRLSNANDFLVELIARAPDRLWGLFTVDPRSRSAPREVEEYGRAPGIRGAKLIPHGWVPEEPAALRVYEACEACDLPILFHSGIFISGRASDACRPARYEAVRRFPRLRVVLAHLGWPWVDEAIAVAFMDLLQGKPPQILLDTSPGTPPVYRRDALHKAVEVLGTTPLLWGSDRFLPDVAASIRELLQSDLAHLRAVGATEEDLERICGGNARDLFRSRDPETLAARQALPERAEPAASAAVR